MHLDDLSSLLYQYFYFYFYFCLLSCLCRFSWLPRQRPLHHRAPHSLCQLLNSTDYTKGSWTKRPFNDSLNCPAVTDLQLSGAVGQERLCAGATRALPLLQWTPRKCSVPSDQQLYELLSDRGTQQLRVRVVGDSIANQLKLNLQCQLDVAALYQQHNWQIDFVWAPFLFAPDKRIGPICCKEMMLMWWSSTLACGGARTRCWKSFATKSMTRSSTSSMIQS
jgi:hypothetical protein